MSSSSKSGERGRRRRRFLSPPGVRPGGEDPELAMARGEVARLGEALKEMAVKVTLLEGKERWG